MRIGFSRKTAATGAGGKALLGQTSTIVIADARAIAVPRPVNMGYLKS